MTIIYHLKKWLVLLHRIKVKLFLCKRLTKKWYIYMVRGEQKLVCGVWACTSTVCLSESSHFVKSISRKNIMTLISRKKFQLIVELSDRHTAEVHALMCDGGVVACVLGNSTSWWFLYSKKSREGRGDGWRKPIQMTNDLISRKLERFSRLFSKWVVKCLVGPGNFLL